jgi:hypothetical protein
MLEKTFRNKPMHRRKRLEGNAFFFKTNSKGINKSKGLLLFKTNNNKKASVLLSQNQQQQKGFFSLVLKPTTTRRLLFSCLQINKSILGEMLQNMEKELKYRRKEMGICYSPASNNNSHESLHKGKEI